MISAITGQLTAVGEGRAYVQTGAFLLELLVPASDVAALSGSVGRELVFHTLVYMEGDASRGNLTPRLIGFARIKDREFFELFTTVKGIGPKTALRALSAPVGQIAAAIERKDARFLVQLDGIGKRTAELVVAELAGKASRFAESSPPPIGGSVAPASPEDEDAIRGLVSLGERRELAEKLAQLAVKNLPPRYSSDQLLREMFRLRGTL